MKHKLNALMLVLIFSTMSNLIANETREIGNEAALDSLASIVAVWHPRAFEAALKGDYSEEVQNGSQLVSGVLVKVDSQFAYIITTGVEASEALMVEFPGDRDWAHTYISDLIKSRLVTQQTTLGNNLTLLVVDLGIASVPLAIRVEAAPIAPQLDQDSDAYLVFNYLGQPEFILWGSKMGDYFVTQDDTFMASLYKVGYSVFNPAGQLIGIIDKTRKILQITPTSLAW